MVFLLKNRHIMKRKTAFIFFAAILSSTLAFSQDTSENQKLSENKSIQTPPSNTQVNPVENHTYYNNNSTEYNSVNSQYKNIPQYDNSIHAYRDTRLGSSSPLYNTYEKNDNGAGAITTNPNKGGGGEVPLPTNLGKPVPVDTAANNTMQSNSYGADSSHLNK
jgi:hypothetical protein